MNDDQRMRFRNVKIQRMFAFGQKCEVSGYLVKVNKYVAAVVARQKDKVVQGIEKGRLDAVTPIPVSKQSTYWQGTPLPMGNRKPYLMVPFINYVCFRRDLDTLVLLLQHSSGKRKKVLGVCDVASMSPLHIAAAHDFITGVAALSEFGFPLHGATDRGITPIMCASSRTDPSLTSLNMAKLMLAEATVDAINAQDQWGQTALHYATDDQWVEAVTLLLSHGADANIRDNDGHTPLFDAVGSSTYTKSRFPSPVDSTREQKGEEILNLLLQHNADVNLQDKHGQTVLHVIVTKLDTNTFNNYMFEAILNAGANIHIKDKEGYTPLLHAVNFYNPRFVCALTKLYSPRQLSWRHKLEAGGEGYGMGPHYTTALYLPIERVADMESQVAACFHIVQILIAAGHAIYSEVYKTVRQCSRFHFAYFPEMLRALERYRRHARPLRDLCRIAVRNALASPHRLRPDAIRHSLPLPEVLCRYVALEDLDDIPAPGPPEPPPLPSASPDQGLKFPAASPVLMPQGAQGPGGGL